MVTSAIDRLHMAEQREGVSAIPVQSHKRSALCKVKPKNNFCEGMIVWFTAGCETNEGY